MRPALLPLCGWKVRPADSQHSSNCTANMVNYFPISKRISETYINRSRKESKVCKGAAVCLQVNSICSRARRAPAVGRVAASGRASTSPGVPSVRSALSGDCPTVCKPHCPLASTLQQPAAAASYSNECPYCWSSWDGKLGAARSKKGAD